jgi:polygalacturonase
MIASVLRRDRVCNRSGVTIQSTRLKESSMRPSIHNTFTTTIHGSAKLLFLLLLFASTAVRANATASYMLAYPAAPYDSPSGTFTLKADTTTIPVTSFYYGRYSFGHLAYQGTTTFVLTVRSGATITGFNISPHATGISGSASGPNLTFSVTQGASTYLIISVKTSSGTLEPMVIAGDPQETGAPTIGGNVYDITASPYNADKTGNTLLNSTIQTAINNISAGGGGTVYFPAGVYKISNNISLASNVTIYLAAGAFLHGSSNVNDYAVLPGTAMQNGQPEFLLQNFLIPGGTSNVAFTGRGVIDANSTVLVTPQTTGGPINGFGNYRKGIIHSGIENGKALSNGITMTGITLKDATTWTIDIEDAQNIAIHNVKMVNDFEWIHSDGYDLSNVNTASVDNCLGVTGDDVFDAKSLDTNPLTNVTYSNDVAYSYEGDGAKVGVGSEGAASNIVFSNIQVVAGQRAVSVSHDQGTGSWSNIHFNDIRMENIEGTATTGEYLVAPIVIWTTSGGEGPVSNVDLCRVTIENSGGFTSQISGANSTGNVSNVTLQDVSIDGTTMTSSNYSSKIAVGSNISGLNFGLVSGGAYVLVSKHNRLALDNGNVTTSNNPVIQWPVDAPETAAQQWTLTSVSGNTYTIVSNKSGDALDNSSSNVSGEGLIQWTPNGGIQQQWTITSLGNGQYKILSAQSGDALDDNDIAPGTKSKNTQVVQFTPNGNDTQQWSLTKQ